MNDYKTITKLFENDQDEIGFRLFKESNIQNSERHEVNCSERHEVIVVLQPSSANEMNIKHTLKY